MASLEIMVVLKPSTCWVRGNTGKAAMARLIGSAGISEQGKGTGWVTRKPERSRLCPHGKPARSTGLSNVPGLMNDLASIGSAHANTKYQACGIPRRRHKLTDMCGGKS